MPLSFYSTELVKQNEKTICSIFDNRPFPCNVFKSVYYTFSDCANDCDHHFIFIAIAVTLRRQDKVFSSQSVRRADQQKKRAIKMAFCIMFSFYMCVLPIVIYFILWEYEIPLSCSFARVYQFCEGLMLNLSSAVNLVYMELALFKNVIFIDWKFIELQITR